MNVLLLALSTVSGENLKCFEYQYGEDPCFDGYYQLEPIPKFLNERLKENDGKPFTWKIKPKERIETKEGHLKKGTCVQVAACMGFEEEHPETHIAIGIIDEDGEETYIENGVNLVSHLKVKKDGRYRVFLENLGAKKAIAGGHYMVITEEE